MAESFNYISFGAREYVEGEINEVTIARGRMFEYTPPEVGSRLESLDAKSLAFLEKLPTFLCSEISRDGMAATMLVKFGRIYEPGVVGREVSAKFETVVDFGEVTFESVEQARAVFGADAFQLYRTHWAVREGAVGDILAALAALSPGPVERATLEQAQSLPLPTDPPARRTDPLGVADSVEKFLELLYQHPEKPGTESFFRGHDDQTFDLTPSLLRKRRDGSWRFMPYEDRLCKELLIAHHDEFRGDQYAFDRLVRMQHFGLPTRLLDISSNPLVALFFACYGDRGVTEADGEVIVFQIDSEGIKYYDSDTVSCLANLSNLTYDQKSEIDLTLDVGLFNKTAIAEKLLHHIKSEKGYFEGRIVPDDLGSILCVKAKRTNSRIKSQSGAFLLFGHETLLPETGQDGIGIARVTVTNKEHILHQLDRININATTVYPSIDRTAVHLREQHPLEVPEGVAPQTP